MIHSGKFNRLKTRIWGGVGWEGGVVLFFLPCHYQVIICRSLVPESPTWFVQINKYYQVFVVFPLRGLGMKNVKFLGGLDRK